METMTAKLREQGAIFDAADVLQHFGSPAAEARAVLHGGAAAWLNGLTVLRVAGADARAFLAAQLTSDVAALDGDHCQLSAWCSPKGRVLVLPWVLAGAAGEWLLVFPAQLAEAVTKRLRMFVLRAKVEIGPAEALCVLGTAHGEQHDLPMPPEDFGLVRQADVVIARIPGRRALVLAPAAEVAGLWATLCRNLTPVGEAAWRLSDIRAGIARIDAANSDRFLPQMLNLQALGGLSFTKGCYPGQEIVARVKYRGQLKRRLYVGRQNGATDLAPGTRISGRDKPDAAVGEVVDAQRLDDTCYFSAVIDMQAALEGGLSLAGGEPVTLDDLPYPVD